MNSQLREGITDFTLKTLHIFFTTLILLSMHLLTVLAGTLITFCIYIHSHTNKQLLLLYLLHRVVMGKRKNCTPQAPIGVHMHNAEFLSISEMPILLSHVGRTEKDTKDTLRVRNGASLRHFV